MKHCKKMKLILAAYIAQRCGLAQTEADLASIVKSVHKEDWLKRFRGSKAALARVIFAIEQLEVK